MWRGGAAEQPAITRCRVTTAHSEDTEPWNLRSEVQRSAKTHTEQFQQRQLLADSQHLLHSMARRTETKVKYYNNIIVDVNFVGKCVCAHRKVAVSTPRYFLSHNSRIVQALGMLLETAISNGVINWYGSQEATLFAWWDNDRFGVAHRTCIRCLTKLYDFILINSRVTCSILIYEVKASGRKMNAGTIYYLAACIACIAV